MRTLLLLFGLLVAPACSEPDPAPGPPTEVEWRRAESLAGSYLLAWRPLEGPLIANEPTSFDVRVERADGSPLTGAQLVLQGSMPGHGHGMNREPRSREVGQGEYRVEGVLLHMSGHWELRFDVLHDGVAESVPFELELP